MSFSLVTIVYDDGNFDAKSTCKRISDVHNSGVASGLAFETIIIDNSKRPIVEIQNLACDINAKYQWCEGYNTYHGQGMNIAANLSSMDAIIYFCSGHCRVIHASWIADILAPLSDPKCGICGTLSVCSYPCVTGVINGNTDWHIQGAITAMRRELLIKFPYGNRFPHTYSDVSMCVTLINAGFKLIDVPSVH